MGGPTQDHGHYARLSPGGVFLCHGDHSVVAFDGKAIWNEIRRLNNARRRAERIFSVVEAALPKKMRNEQIGDALEEINQLGRSRAWIRGKVISTVFWLAINAARELMGVVWGRATK